MVVRTRWVVYSVIVLGVLLAAFGSRILFQKSDVNTAASLASGETLGEQHTGNVGSLSHSEIAEAAPDAQRATHQSSPGLMGVGQLDYLPFEAALLRDGAISMEEVQQLVFDEKFDAYLARIKSQAGRDQESVRIGELYRKEFEHMAQVHGRGALALGDLVCGTSVCIGVMHGYGEAGMTRYDAWRSALDQPGAIPTHAFLDGAVTRAGDRTENRFFLSIDPAVSALHMRR